MQVPFVDLRKQYQSLKEEMDPELREVIENGMFVRGPKVEAFERDFAAYCGKKEAVGVNSGTAALHLALAASGIGKGDEVITVPNTFIATLEAVSQTGATPRLVDVGKEDCLMDVTQLEKTITPKTKAILPVHLYGQTADMQPIFEVAEKHGLRVIEDAAQAQGAKYRQQRSPVGNIGCFSFYPAKNLGAFGEAGAVVGDDAEIMEKVRLLHAHGEHPKNVHNMVGYNYRMEGIQGAVLGVKLRHLDEWNTSRRKWAHIYDEQLGERVQIPVEREGNYHVYHVYVIQCNDRAALMEFLKKEGIATGIHYPVPVHLQPAYAALGYGKGTFPVAEEIQERIVSLPIFPEMVEEQAVYVAEKVREYYTRS